MQESSIRSFDGVVGCMEEWLNNNEWPCNSGRPNVQPSSMIFSFPGAQYTRQDASCSYDYHYDHPSTQQWSTIEQPAESPAAYYQPPAGVSSGPLVHHNAPIPIPPPIPAAHLLTVHDRDVSGSPTVVSRSPVPPSQSPPILPTTAIKTTTSPPSFKIPPQKGRRHWACPECKKVFNRLSACEQVGFQFLVHEV
ncbi:hypothetical protein FRC02_003323 [Tulasnella sp. 418]|nr:hypothetical protein FRC02_003323 [Tulasnella sp. 418]